jgi:hypothetical protein
MTGETSRWRKGRPAVLENWDEVQHDPVTNPPKLAGMAKDDAVDAIRGWFFENFEDPAESTPYESAEGGYQYIWGGPYDTRDIIENVFYRRTSKAVIEAAIDEIDEGMEWVPNSSRRQAPDEGEEFEDLEPSPSELYARMQEQIDAIQEALDHAPDTPAGMGHNQPPEPLDIEPLDAEDRAELSSTLGVLKAQPVEPNDNGKVATEALAKFETKREKLGKWLLKQGEVFTTEAVKEAGKQFGKWAAAAFWLWLMDMMFGVSQAVHAWLQALGVPF